MPSISKIKLGQTVYDLNDASARSQIAGINTTLESKADASNVFTKSEIINNYATQDSVAGKVDTTVFTTFQESMANELNNKMSTSVGLTKSDAELLYAKAADLGSFVNKTDYSSKISEIESDISDKADSASVYNKTESDDLFATKTQLDSYATSASMNAAIADSEASTNNKITGVQVTLAELEERLDNLDASGETLQTLKQIKAELSDPKNAEGLESFLDTVQAAMNQGTVIDNNTTYTFTVPSEGEDEGTLIIESHDNVTSTSVWVPMEDNPSGGGSEEGGNDKPEPTPEP